MSQGAVVDRSAAAEALKKWEGGRYPMGRSLGRLEIRGYYFRKVLENTGANLCNLVHFLGHRVIKSGTENRHFPSHF